MSIPVVRSLVRAAALAIGIVAAVFGVVIALSLEATSARAQGAPSADASPVTRAAMEELAWLEGHWEGEASYQTPTGDRETILQTERIERRLNGVVLVVEGTGREKNADGSPGEVVFQAFGVISYDPDRERYTFRAFRDGRSIDAETSLEAGVFTWSFETPGAGHVRFRIRNDQGAWHETGEFSRDGQEWHPFFEMRLHRTGEAEGD